MSIAEILTGTYFAPLGFTKGLLAILGGSVGAILGMRVWHHKTRHWYFKYGLPAILLAQLALAWYLGGLH